MAGTAGTQEFSGFPERLLTFYEGLEADNTRAYWQDHRAVYDADVAAPLRALLDALGPECGEAKVFRPYRDVRFSRDKTPYKTAAAAAIGDDVQGGLYLQVSARGLMVAGGAHGLATDQARRLRAAAADERAGDALLRVLDDLRSAGFTVDGERLKRVPRDLPELPAGSRRDALLTLKTLFAWQEHEPQEWLHTPAVREVVAVAWRRLAPLNDWLRSHVGPTRTPPRP